MKMKKYQIRAVFGAFCVLAVCFLAEKQAFAQAAPPATWELPPPPSGPGESGLADPYQPPVQESAPLFSNAGNFLSNPFGSQADKSDTTTAQRLFQNWGVEMTWITADDGSKNLGLFQMDFMGEIAFPIFALERPLYFVPKFSIYYWDGPQSDHYDMPPQTFDASLGLSWCPRWTPACLGGATNIDFDLYFSVGIFSDFRKVNSDSFRFPSHAMFSTKLTNNISVKLGILYMDRVRYDILPAVGLIWKPSPRWEFEIMFPNPRVTYRPAQAHLKDLELYARGEYGGGSWTIKHDRDGYVDTVDYNDYRIMLGGSWRNARRHSGFFEFGLSFARELRYDVVGRRSLDPGFVLAGGMHF